jgi:branched-chain amino acid transport system ATP-binding protein
VSSSAAIEVHELSQRFGGVHALENVSLTVPAGQIRGIIGPNGAGKTTLLNVLSGLQAPSRGRVRCFGIDVSRWPPYRIAREAGIVRTFQTVRLFSTMDVFDNILVAAAAQTPPPEERLLGRRKRARGSALERTERVLARLDLDGVRHRRVTELAYGLRRKVELARALVMQPRIIVLDEPAAGLNGAERAELGHLLLEIREGGLTVLLVEHQMDLVSAVCDELTVLDFGRVICDGPPERVVEDPGVLQAFLGAPGGRL